MRGLLAFVAGGSKHPVILVHGRNDDATRWDSRVSSWSARGCTEGVNLFRFACREVHRDGATCGVS